MAANAFLTGIVVVTDMNSINDTCSTAWKVLYWPLENFKEWIKVTGIYFSPPDLSLCYKKFFSLSVSGFENINPKTALLN